MSHSGMQHETRSMVKVTSPLKLEILPFSNAISAIYNRSWQQTSAPWTWAQCLNFIGPDFLYLS